MIGKNFRWRVAGMTKGRGGLPRLETGPRSHFNSRTHEMCDTDSVCNGVFSVISIHARAKRATTMSSHVATSCHFQFTHVQDVRRNEAAVMAD